MSNTMKIAIVSKMPYMHYSGGRYHAWNMGESLAHMGHEVYFIANNEPVFYDDFADNDGHEKIKLVLTKDFNLQELADEIPEKLDFVVMVPHRSYDLYIFEEVRRFCKNKSAMQVLLNFESPNWMNQYIPKPHDPELWNGWKLMCEDECIVLSTDNESEKYAKEFYGTREDIHHEVWNLSINTLIADKVPIEEKENRIITFIRLSDEHKGGFDILDCINEDMKGYTFVFVYGASKKSERFDEFVARLDELKEKYGIDYEMKSQLGELEKFKELARAKFMLFPSYFEGYGLPPIEAMYMETTCLVYELPVLHEICGDGLVYCERGNWKEMGNTLGKLIKEDYVPLISLRKKIKETADFYCAASKIECVLSKYLGGNNE